MTKIGIANNDPNIFALCVTSCLRELRKRKYWTTNPWVKPLYIVTSPRTKNKSQLFKCCADLWQQFSVRKSEISHHIIIDDAMRLDDLRDWAPTHCTKLDHCHRTLRYENSEAKLRNVFRSSCHHNPVVFVADPPKPASRRTISINQRIFSMAVRYLKHIQSEGIRILLQK